MLPRPARASFHLVDGAVGPAHALWAELLPHARRPRDAIRHRRIWLLLLLLLLLHGGWRRSALLRC